MTPKKTGVSIGSRLELFVEDTLIAQTTGEVSLRINQPTMREVVFESDAPFEGNKCLGYKTYFRDGDRFRLYYQAWSNDFLNEGERTLYRESRVRIGYLESADGVCWERKALGRQLDGLAEPTNIIFEGFGQYQRGVHGFAPFVDANPDNTGARFKAVGASMQWPTSLWALESDDGINWRLFTKPPIMRDGAFDSQNLAFFDTEVGLYRAYIRDFDGDVRGIKTCTSSDFLQWSDPTWLRFPGSPEAQLYTNQVLPYYRAPHILVGFPMRYVDRGWTSTIEQLPELEHRVLRSQASPRFGSALTDTVFMASRDGHTFKRWDEAFIRPGPRAQGSWTYGDCSVGWGILETASDVEGSPNELTIYATEGYWRGTSTSLRRYTLRVDGFVSAHATLRGGELVTRPINFIGDELVINLSTSAAGSACVALERPDGTPIGGFGFEDCTELVGDSIAMPVHWLGGRLTQMRGQAVRVRFLLRDADLYSYRFKSSG